MRSVLSHRHSVSSFNGIRSIARAEEWNLGLGDSFIVEFYLVGKGSEAIEAQAVVNIGVGIETSCVIHALSILFRRDGLHGLVLYSSDGFQSDFGHFLFGD